MKIAASKRAIKSSKNGYLYFTKHGVGPGTLPKDVKLLDWRDVDDNVTAIWLDRFLTTKELKEYDIYPETSDHHKAYSKKLNSCIITASTPDNSYQHYYAYDYKGKYRFSIHYDDVSDVEDPETSFYQFRASVSLIKPYDDADYAWARIEKGSISYVRKGKLIKKEYYFMFNDYGTDEDELYEDANDWMNDVINKACDTLIDLNQNVEPVIIHNSKSIQSATANNEYRVDDITASTVLDMNPEFRNNLFDGKSSSPVKSYTDVESYEDDQYMDRFDKDIELYDLMAIKDVEDTDGFSTEYAIYQIILKDGSIEYECYFGDSDIYGPWNGDGLDFESESYNEAVAWYNSYGSEDVTTSTITSARNDSKVLTTEEIDAMLNNLRSDLHADIIKTLTSSEFGFDKKEADEYSRIDIEPDPDYDGIRIEVGAELSYKGLDKLREILDKTLNLYVKDAYFDMAEPGILETYFAATDIIPDSVESCQTIEAGYYDVPERPLDPPDYDEGDEIETEATIEIPFNQVITIDRDGGWSYSDEEYNFTKTDDGKSDHYDDEYHVYLDDNVGIVEKLDSFLLEKLPATPGTYRIQGDLTLVYDIENIRQYSNNDGYWSDEDGFNPLSYETYTDDAEVYYNKSKSSLDNFKYTKIK